MSKRYFPFHTIGFRSNPFRVLTHEEWSEVAVIPPQIEKILASNFTHLQIIGEQGVGKTSTLLALRQYYSIHGKHAQYRYIPPGENRLHGDIRKIDILLLDEMQRLSKIPRTRLVRKIAHKNGEGIRLICSTHEDLKPLFEKQNRPLDTILLDKHEKLFQRQIIERRLQYFAVDKRSKVSISEEAFHFLYETFRNDLRSLEDFLYVVFQQQRFQGEITDKTLRRAMEQNKPTPERG